MQEQGNEEERGEKVVVKRKEQGVKAVMFNERSRDQLTRHISEPSWKNGVTVIL